MITTGFCHAFWLILFKALYITSTNKAHTTLLGKKKKVVDLGKVPTLIPGGGGQGLVGVPIFGGSAGGTSSFLTDVSSSIFFVMATLLMELEVAELKGSSLLTFVWKEISSLLTFVWKEIFTHSYI